MGAQERSYAAAAHTRLAVKRRPPRERDSGPRGTDWSLQVEYLEAEGTAEHMVRLPLSDESVAFEVDALLRLVGAGDPHAGRDLFVSLHAEWGRSGPVGRHPAWEAVFRHLAPLAVGPTGPPGS